MITFTASVMPEDKQATLNLNANSFIEKSIGFREFLNTISATLQYSAG
jgi:DNA-binding response OmpR family regulator